MRLLLCAVTIICAAGCSKASPQPDSDADTEVPEETDTDTDTDTDSDIDPLAHLSAALQVDVAGLYARGDPDGDGDDIEFMADAFPAGSLVVKDVHPGIWSIIAIDETETACFETISADVAAGEYQDFEIPELYGAFNAEEFTCSMP
jgi:hypothetical protein